MNGTVPTEAGTAKARILVVDDDQTFGEALCQVLGHHGYAVVAATDFRTALDVLEGEGEIHLMLVDIVMPGSVNGIALSRMARLRRRDLKIVYLTGYNLAGIENEALGPILRKPVDNQMLIEEIDRVLAG